MEILVSAPVSSQQWVGRVIVNGTQLAVAEINAAGGVDVGGGKRQLSVKVIDNGASAQRAVDAARTAVADHALALITDGTGAKAVAEVTDPVHLPVLVTFEGGAGLVDAAARPTIFRVAPQDKAMATRLADYVAGKHATIAVLSDTSQFGADGDGALRAAFARNAIPIQADLAVDPTTPDVSAQVSQLKATGANTFIIWARSTVTAAAIRAAGQSGWQPRLFTSPAGEDPSVRQQLDDHPEWYEGLTFVSSRITSETGPAPFAAYRKAYEAKFGVEKVGVNAAGSPVVEPPDWPMYSYDAVKLVAAAVTAAHGLGAGLITELETVVVTGANGDERGFSPTVRESVTPGDLYFGRFHNKRFAPVTDDLLSTYLPPVAQ